MGDVVVIVAGVVGVVGVVVVALVVTWIAFFYYLCRSGDREIRGECGCMTLDDEPAENARHSDRQNNALASPMEPATYVPEGQAIVGDKLYNSYTGQTMTPPYPLDGYLRAPNRAHPR